MCDFEKEVCPRGGRHCGGRRLGVYYRKDEARHVEICLEHRYTLPPSSPLLVPLLSLALFSPHRCVNKHCTTFGTPTLLATHEVGCDLLHNAIFSSEIARLEVEAELRQLKSAQRASELSRKNQATRGASIDSKGAIEAPFAFSAKDFSLKVRRRWHLTGSFGGVRLVTGFTDLQHPTTAPLGPSSRLGALSAEEGKAGGVN